MGGMCDSSPQEFNEWIVAVGREWQRKFSFVPRRLF